MASPHQTSEDTSPSFQEQITHLKELLRKKQEKCAEVCDVEAAEADESKRRQQKSANDQDGLIQQLSRVLSEEEEARVNKIEENVNAENAMNFLASTLEETHRERMADLTTLGQEIHEIRAAQHERLIQAITMQRRS